MTTTADDDAPAPRGPVASGAPGVAMAGAPGVAVTGVRRSFGDVVALDGVDLTARAGAVTALVGPNGSGKTTLLLILAGLVAPDAGAVAVAGFDPATQSAAARGRTGWMPDAFGTWDSLTAREVLLTFAAAYRLTAGRGSERATELLETVHLTEFADRPASVLSRGQKQRLGLARALVHDPDVLLLDEPASGLDPRSRVDLRILLRGLAAQGKTVLVSSHVLSELDELCDDAVFLSRGRTVQVEATLPAAEARRTWRLRALSLAALTAWLDDTGASWRPDDAPPAPTSVHQDGPPHPGPDLGPDPEQGPGAVLIAVDGEAGAAALLRDLVLAGVQVTSLAPAGGALEQAYLALDEDRR